MEDMEVQENKIQEWKNIKSPNNSRCGVDKPALHDYLGVTWEELKAYYCGGKFTSNVDAFSGWFYKEKEAGMIDMKVTRDPVKVNLEDLAEDLLYFVLGAEVEDKEIF